MEVMKGWLKDARAYGVNDEEDWDKLASRRPWAAMAAILRTVKTMTIEHVQAFNIDRGGLSLITVSALWVFTTYITIVQHTVRRTGINVFSQFYFCFCFQLDLFYFNFCAFNCHLRSVRFFYF